MDATSADLFRLLQFGREGDLGHGVPLYGFVKGNGYFEHRRNEQSKYWMYETINEQLRNSFFQNEQIVSRLAEAEAMVLSGRQTSFVAAKQLLDEYFASLR